MKFVIKQNKKTKQYTWKLIADNGENIAHGEPYTQKHNCLDAVKLVQGSNNMYFIEDTTA